jgi:hypothetical protein
MIFWIRTLTNPETQRTSGNAIVGIAHHWFTVPSHFGAKEPPAFRKASSKSLMVVVKEEI